MIELTGNEIDRLAGKHGGNGEPIVKAFKQRSPRCHFKQMDLVYGEHPSGYGIRNAGGNAQRVGTPKMLNPENDLDQLPEINKGL